MADEHWSDGQAPPPRRRSPGKLILLGAGGCLLAFVLCGGMCAGIFALVQGTMRQSDAYGEALRLSREDAQVMQAFGGSLEPGFFVSGSVEIKNGHGNADLTIPVSGPGGKGSIHVTASKPSGASAWTIESLVVTKDADTWDLTPAGTSATP